MYKIKKDDNAYGLATDIGFYFNGFVNARTKEEAIEKIKSVGRIAEKKGVYLILKEKIRENNITKIIDIID